MSFELIVIGTSWGGPEALKILFSDFPKDFTLPLAVVQHRSRSSDEMLCVILQKSTSLAVREVEDKDPIAPGHIYLAPPDYHLLVEKGSFALSIDEPVNYSRPSIDVLFESAADACREKVIGVILTGANKDGACGMAEIKRRKGFTIVQDPKTAENSTMPEAAIKAADIDKILPLEEIGPFLCNLVRTER